MSRSLIITTYNRPELFSKLIESIEFDMFDKIAIVFDKGDFEEYSNHPKLKNAQNVIKIQPKNNIGVGRAKKMGLDAISETAQDYIYFIEDDIEIKNNDIWDYCEKVSVECELPHFNWEKCISNNLKARLQYREHVVDFFHHPTGAFQFFTYDIFSKHGCELDPNYKNGFEHIDVEYWLWTKKILDQFWYFPCPQKMSDYLKYNGEKSTITESLNYNNDVMDGLRYFIQKWKIHPAQIPDISEEEFVFKLKNKHSR